MQNQTTDSDLQRAIDDITKRTGGVTRDNGNSQLDSMSSLENQIAPVVPTITITPPIMQDLSLGSEETGETRKPKVEINNTGIQTETPQPLGEIVSAEEVVNSENGAAGGDNGEANRGDTNEATSHTTQEKEEIEKVKRAALKDLAPLLDKMNVNPAQKFRIYRDMFETLGDNSVLEPAYRAVKEIKDEKERGEALLFLIDTIDDLK